MGYTWTVSKWAREVEGSPYSYVAVYEGNSALGAVRAALQAKRQGSKCIKIEWRPM